MAASVTTLRYALHQLIIQRHAGFVKSIFDNNEGKRDSYRFAAGLRARIHTDSLRDLARPSQHRRPRGSRNSGDAREPRARDGDGAPPHRLRGHGFGHRVCTRAVLAPPFHGRAFLHASNEAGIDIQPQDFPHPSAFRTSSRGLVTIPTAGRRMDAKL